MNRQDLIDANQYLVDSRNRCLALHPAFTFRQSPLAWILGVSLIAAGIAGCSLMPLAQPRTQLMGAPVLNGFAQVRDPQTGMNSFVSCAPCATPTPKTPVHPSGADSPGAADPILAAQHVALPVLATLDSHTEATLAVPADFPAIPTGLSSVADEVPAVTVVSTRSALQATQAIRTLRSLPFPRSVARMNADAKDNLSSLLPLAAVAERIYIGGRTDAKGTVQRNRTLAAARAATVRAAFVAAGVDPRKLKVSSCITCFITSNDSEAGRSANRRVDIELVMPSIANAPTSNSKT